MLRLSSSGLLRAGAVVSLLYCFGHQSGAPWTPVQGAAPANVVALMHQVSFQTMDVTRTYWDFYYGFGLIITTFLAGQAVALWLLARVARRDAALAVPLAALFFAGALVNATLSYRFFFPLPALFSGIIAALLAGSIAVTWFGTRSRAAGALAQRHAHGA